MKRIILLVFSINFFISAYSQKNVVELTVFANTGTVLFSGKGFYPGVGGGLELGLIRKKGAFTFEGSYTYFAARGDEFNVLDRGWATIMPGYTFNMKKNFYAHVNGGLVLETNNTGIGGFGLVYGGGLGYRPKLGNGYLNIFAKLNLTQGSLRTSNFTVFGIGYVIPFSRAK